MGKELLRREQKGEEDGGIAEGSCYCEEKNNLAKYFTRDVNWQEGMA